MTPLQQMNSQSAQDRMEEIKKEMDSCKNPVEKDRLHFELMQLEYCWKEGRTNETTTKK